MRFKRNDEQRLECRRKTLLIKDDNDSIGHRYEFRMIDGDPSPIGQTKVEGLKRLSPERGAN
jgi:hypothetical protein